MTAETKESPSPTEAVDPKLAAGVSPNVAVMKGKRARRINNWPLLIVFISGGIIALTLGSAAVKRANAAKAEVGGATAGGSTQAIAQDIVGPEQGGVITPKEQPKAEPEQPQPTPIAPKEPAEEKPIPAAAVVDALPTAPPVASPRGETARKAREKRLRQFEAALDGPIKAQIEDAKPNRRNVNDEMARLEQQIAALNAPGADAYAGRLAAAKAALEGGEAGPEFGAQGDLSRTRQFERNESWRNPAGVEAPATPFIIRTGSVIPAILISGINSDLPGQIVGQVARDVYDTPTGRHVLIPQGSRLVGEYSSQVQFGQSRVFAVWQRIIFPDGKALDIGSMPGSSGAGYSGFRDRVNNHFVRIFGSAIMMSAILAGVEMTQNSRDYAQGDNQQRMSDALSESLGQVLGGVMAEMLQKNMNIAPTLEIRPGYRLNVMLVKDLEFKESYQAFDYKLK